MLNVKTSSLNVLMKDGKSVESEVNSKQDSLCKGSFTGNLNNCIDSGCFWCNFTNISNGPIKSGFGNIGISSDSGNRFDLFAKLVCVYENNMYTIKGSGVVKNLALGNPNGVNYGINISAIANILGLNLGGSYSFGEVTFYKYSNGIFEKNVNINGFGATLELSNEGFFRPARYYNESGGIGGWKIGSFANEDMIEFEIYVK